MKYCNWRDKENNQFIDLTINLRHIMDFGTDRFEMKIMNTGEIVRNMACLNSHLF